MKRRYGEKERYSVHNDGTYENTCLSIIMSDSTWRKGTSRTYVKNINDRKIDLPTNLANDRDQIA